MTTERKYFCNLCGDRVVEEAQGRGDMEGVGVYFTTSTGSTFRFTKCHESENHICGSCIAAIRKTPSS